MSVSLNPLIICVEDDEDSCELISLMLRFADESYRVSAVSTAREALALMESQRVDLFILDYHLPGMSGIELCRRIRQTDSQTPVLFYSGMARAVDIDEAMKAGATVYLVKPNDLDRLAETVAQLLSQSPAISESESAVKNEMYYEIF